MDSFFAQSRIVDRVNDFLKAGAKENPGCVERFVCETYRTGETMEGIPYLLMQNFQPQDRLRMLRKWYERVFWALFDPEINYLTSETHIQSY